MLCWGSNSSKGVGLEDLIPHPRVESHAALLVLFECDDAQRRKGHVISIALKDRLVLVLPLLLVVTRFENACNRLPSPTMAV